MSPLVAVFLSGLAPELWVCRSMSSRNGHAMAIRWWRSSKVHAIGFSIRSTSIHWIFSMRVSDCGIALGEIVARRRLIKNAGNGTHDGLLVFPGNLNVNDRPGDRAQEQNGEDAPRIGHFFAYSQADRGFGRLGQADQLGGGSQMQSLFPWDTNLS